MTRDMVAASVPCGPDAGPLIDAIEGAIAAGVDHVYLHQIGDDQEGFCKFWAVELAPKARNRS